MILQSQSHNSYKKRRKRNVKTISQSNKNTPLHLPKCLVLCCCQVQSRHFTFLQSPSYKKEGKETLEMFLYFYSKKRIKQKKNLPKSFSFSHVQLAFHAIPTEKKTKEV